MTSFTKKEIAFIQKQDVCRVSTISPKGWPQTTPVLPVFDGKAIYFATDFDTKKYQNLKANNWISFVADTYDREPQGITIQGTVEILESGEEFAYSYDLLVARHAYYQKNPFKEGEAPIIKIIPARKASWGIE